MRGVSPGRHEAGALPAGLVLGVSGDDCVAYDLPFVTTVEMRAVKRLQPAPQGVWQTNSLAHSCTAKLARR
jgi:hypothetical protein